MLASILPGAVSSEVYSFILNGSPLGPADFSLIPANLVSRVEIYWTPGKWGIKKIAIYTEPNFPHDEKNFELYKVQGYTKAHVFHEPSKEHKEPDYRPTIYWNPSIDTGPDGKASLSFTSSDVDGTYKVTIEGATSQGEFFRVTKYLNITK
jgi:hypothetical protein